MCDWAQRVVMNPWLRASAKVDRDSLPLPLPLPVLLSLSFAAESRQLPQPDVCGFGHLSILTLDYISLAYLTSSSFLFLPPTHLHKYRSTHASLIA